MNQSFLTQAAPPAAPAGREAILEIQCRLTEEGNSLAQVIAKSEEIEKEITRLNGSAPTAPNVDAPRELLLADIAIGKSKVDDLVKFDREVHDAKKKFDATVKGIREKISPLESTFAGLRRKAAIHNRTIENLRAEHRNLCQAYLLNAAEDAGRDYAEAITRAVAAMDLTITFASLHKRCGGTNHIGEDIGTLDVPPLGTASTRGVLPALDPASRAAAYDAAEAEVLDRLKSESIAVPFPETAPPTPVRTRVPGIGEGTPVSVARPEEALRMPDGHIAPPNAVSDFDPFSGQE